jgi:hypothetical protein
LHHVGISHSPSRCTRHTVATYERSHRQRASVEEFVRRAFALKHGASIRSFMPTLYALQGRDDRICGVAGVRSAAAEPLFLERYLSQPIESALSERVGERATREQIVEVGNLSSLSCRAAFHLVALLPRLLMDRGHLWVTFTATDAVRGILDRFNAPVIELSGATKDKVANLGDDWGRYYECDPRVMAAWLPHGLSFEVAGTAQRHA